MPTPLRYERKSTRLDPFAPDDEGLPRKPLPPETIWIVAMVAMVIVILFMLGQ